MFDAEDIFFTLVIANFMVAFLFIGAQLYLAYFRMNEILKSLSNSRGIILRRFFWGKDPVTRFLLLITVGSMLTFHRRSIKIGELDAEDYRNFPTTLYGTIKISYITGLGGGAFLFFLWGIGKLMNWIK